MPRVRKHKDAKHGKKATGDAPSRDELLSPGIRIGPISSLCDALKACRAGEIVDAAGGSPTAPFMSPDAALAALRSYWVVYGNEVGIDTFTILASLYFFWLAGFGSRGNAPCWLVTTAYEEAADAREDTTSSHGPH